MFEIIVPEGHDTMSRVTLDGTVYWLRFTYNGTEDYWSVGVYDEDENPIIAMEKIVPWFRLFNYPYTDLPGGTLFCDCPNDTVKGDDFKNRVAHMVYIEEAEIS